MKMTLRNLAIAEEIRLLCAARSPLRQKRGCRGDGEHRYTLKDVVWREDEYSETTDWAVGLLVSGVSVSSEADAVYASLLSPVERPVGGLDSYTAFSPSAG